MGLFTDTKAKNLDLWETIEDVSSDITKRMKVPGGWVVQCIAYYGSHLSSAMVFIPDEEYSWSKIK